MAKDAKTTGKAKVAKPVKTKAPKTGTPKAKAAKNDSLAGASTSPITLGNVQARLIGDQLRGLAYLSKKLALAIREKNLPTPFDPARIEAISEDFYGLADELRLLGDDGSNGG